MRPWFIHRDRSRAITALKSVPQPASQVRQAPCQFQRPRPPQRCAGTTPIVRAPWDVDLKRLHTGHQQTRFPERGFSSLLETTSHRRTSLSFLAAHECNRDTAQRGSTGASIGRSTSRCVTPGVPLSLTDAIAFFFPPKHVREHVRLREFSRTERCEHEALRKSRLNRHVTVRGLDRPPV